MGFPLLELSGMIQAWPTDITMGNGVPLVGIRSLHLRPSTCSSNDGSILPNKEGHRLKDSISDLLLKGRLDRGTRGVLHASTRVVHPRPCNTTLIAPNPSCLRRDRKCINHHTTRTSRHRSKRRDTQRMRPKTQQERLRKGGLSRNVMRTGQCQ